MTTVEYLKRKNEILKKHGLGYDIVPEDQIKETRKVHLSLDGDDTACPYCAIWFGEDECGNCPMKKAGNGCLDNGSTYKRAVDFFKKKGGFMGICTYEPVRIDLEKLIDEYNKGE